MTYTVALAGKGGTGKTTLAGLLIKYMVKNGKTPILAVDADCNANLNEVLGLNIACTVGGAREDMKKGSVPSGMTKDIFMEMRLEEAIVESDGFDLIVMGQPEGAGCYCAANSLLTNFLDRIQNNYPYVVMDNEAGLEHLSRRTTRNVDALLVVSRGATAKARVALFKGGLIFLAACAVGVQIVRGLVERALAEDPEGGVVGVGQDRRAQFGPGVGGPASRSPSATVRTRPVRDG